MDIREFTTYSESSPVCGYGIWIVIEEGKRIHLLHPIHLAELIITEYEFKSGSGNTLWPINSTGCVFNSSRFISSFKERIAFFVENGRSFPIQTVAKAIAEFEEIPFDKAMSYIGSLSVDEFGESISRISDKANRVYRVNDSVDINSYRGRAFALLSAFKANGPASIYQITPLVDGKLKTKTDLSRVVTYFVNKLASEGVLQIVA